MTAPRPAVRGVVVGVLVLGFVAGCHHRRLSNQSPRPAPADTTDLAVRHFPGVDVIRTPSGGVRIRVFSGAIGARPLYVVDGTPVTVDPLQGLDWLTPEQIEKIEVLKDPAQTAVYGLRGVDGVIVITTSRTR